MLDSASELVLTLALGRTLGVIAPDPQQALPL